MTEFKVDVKALLDEERQNHKAVVDKLNFQIKELQAMVLYERERREYAEQKLAELNKPKRKRRTKAEVEAERANQKEYSEFKSNGVRKKTKMESIKSYTDFKKIQDFFLEKNQIPYYAIWTVGVCMGVRASDIVTLRWRNILNEDFSFKERIKLYEQKTGKLQDCLITEAMRDAFIKLLNSVQWNIDMNGYIFTSIANGAGIAKKDSPMSRDCCYENFRKAASAVGIEYHIGTHTMRASFANIVACVDKSTIDMNMISKVQGLLNHSDPRVTMKYLGTLDRMYDNARRVVSDFVLGKYAPEVDELVCGEQTNMADVVKKLDDIKQLLNK